MNHRFPSGARRVLLALAGLAACTGAAAQAAAAVDITFQLDAAHRLTVRYRAPESVSLLQFAVAEPRVERAFRTPMMRPADDCGTLVEHGIALRHGPGCEGGALFVVQPETLGLDAFYEPAQPTTDGGVLFHTRYYAASAPGLDLRWNFVPEPGGYVVRKGRRDTAAVTHTVHVPVAMTAVPGLSSDALADQWLGQLDALDYVFLGHSPAETADGVLWVRDPALPASVTAPVVDAARLAMRGYAAAAQVSPAGPVAIVMIAAPARGAHAGFHGDRSEGRMLRLSFQAPWPAAPDEADVEEWRHFGAHEVAHLWNNGVFRSDADRPWLHEGDSEWASLNLLHDAHLLSDEGFVERLEAAVNTCLVVRGERVASTLAAGRAGDDPYACGIALQLLGWLELRKRDPAAVDTPLERWGELHRRFPDIAPYRFTVFFDDGKSTLMRDLLLDDRTPFASTYRKDLATLMLFQSPAGEPGGRLRERTMGELAALLVRADCGRLGMTTTADGVVLDAGLQCKALPAGARIVSVAGEPVAGRPRAAWAAAHRQCAERGRVEVGLRDAPAVLIACPADLPDAPAWIRLPADVLQRIGLMARPVHDDAGAPAPAR